MRAQGIATQPLRGAAAALLLALLVLPFADHAARLGLSGWAGSVVDGHLFAAGVAAASRWVMGLHMIAGGALSVLAPLQLIGIVRRKAPLLHRWNGRLVVLLAVVTTLAGLAWIAREGTIGGPVMSAAFALYGALLGASALQAARHARRGDIEKHRRWALRLFALALGSWLYRVHYGLWALTFGDLGRAGDFSGAFDQVNLWAFYLPYLGLLEVLFAFERRRRKSRA